MQNMELKKDGYEKMTTLTSSCDVDLQLWTYNKCSAKHALDTSSDAIISHSHTKAVSEYNFINVCR